VGGEPLSASRVGWRAADARRGVPPLERSGQAHGVFQCDGALQLGVDAQGVAEARGVDGDLLLLRDAVASSQELEELILKLGDGARA
jgi:hypothetical protein